MYPAVRTHMVKDEPYAIGLAVLMDAVVQVDPMREIHSACHAGAVIGDAPAATLNGSCSHEFGRGTNDGVVASIA